MVVCLHIEEEFPWNPSRYEPFTYLVGEWLILDERFQRKRRQALKYDPRAILKNKLVVTFTEGAELAVGPSLVIDKKAHSRRILLIQLYLRRRPIGDEIIAFDTEIVLAVYKTGNTIMDDR
jgi:hypothetical protein